MTRIPPSLCAGALLAALMLAVPAHGATTATPGRGVIVTPLSLINASQLNFGTLYSGAAAGTVTINPTTQARTTTGGAAAAGGTPTAAHFVGFGTAARPVWLQIPGGTVTLNRVGGGASMTVSNWTTFSPNTNWLLPTVYLLDGGGFFNVRVGGRLNVGANQMQGFYQGSFNVTLNYF